MVVERVIWVRMKKTGGQMGQHAARSLHLVSGYFAPPRVMLTISRQAD